MTDKTKKKFPWVRYLLTCFLFSIWTLFILTDFELAFVSHDHSDQIASVLFIAYLLSTPRLNKKKLSQEKLSIWTKDISTITWSDFNTELFIVSLNRFLLLMLIASVLYSIGISAILESANHNIITKLSLWAWFMVIDTKRFMDWQKEEVL